MAQTKSIWTLAEVTDNKINPVSYEIIARAVELKEKLADSKIVSIMLGPEMEEAEVKKLIQYGADEVLYIKDPRLTHFIIQDFAAILSDLGKTEQPFIFLAGATTYGRTLMPYLAIQMYAGLTADCTILDIEAETDLLLQTRPAIGGNILATIKTPTARPQMATVRPHSTKPLTPDENRKGLIRSIPLKDDYFHSKMRFVRFESLEDTEGNISEAPRIVAGGRGLGKAENFELVLELAKNLDAAVGATREAVDRGWISYPHQIGLSGKTVNPELYIAMGISGTIQHLAGMQTAQHIIAINKDPEAQIFRVSNLSIVGNHFEIIPHLIEKIKTRRGMA